MLHDNLSEECEAEEDEPSSNYTYYFKGGKISKVYDTRIRQGTSQEQKLCKLTTKSYLHLEWLTQEEIEARDIQDTKFNKMHLQKQK